MKIETFGFCCLIISTGCNYIGNSYRETFKLNSASIKCNCNLYVEVYSAGILHKLTDDFLTDSLNFRIYAGTFNDEVGYLHYKCSGDSLLIEKVERANEVFKLDSTIVDKKLVITPNLNYDLKIVSSKVYSLRELKNSHIFE
jgi:hypothetical protein